MDTVDLEFDTVNDSNCDCSIDDVSLDNPMWVKAQETTRRCRFGFVDSWLDPVPWTVPLLQRFVIGLQNIIEELEANVPPGAVTAEVRLCLAGC